jgi:hypothetical protein
VATFTWGGQAGTRETVIRAEARVDNRLATREIEIVAAPTNTARTLRLPDNTAVQHWFAERQLRDSVVVVVDNSSGDCSNNIVVFRPPVSDGSTSPDSVRATVEHGSCVANTWWTLGKPVGRQHLRAFLASEPSKAVTITAVGRALPRLGVGVAFVKDWRNYQALDTTKKVVGADHGWQVTPTVIADFPIVPSAQWMRGAIGVSLKDASRDWYVGLSLLQPLLGVTRESVGQDLEIVLHAGRRNVLKDNTCDDDGDVSDCVNRKDKVFFPLGIGFMGFVDASNLLSSIQNIFK